MLAFYSATTAVERAEVARDDSTQTLSQLRGLPTAVCTLEMLLRLHPELFGALQTCFAGLRQVQYLAAPVGRIRLDRDQAVAFKGPVLRPSVVRSTTSSAASRLIDIGP